VISHFLT